MIYLRAGVFAEGKLCGEKVGVLPLRTLPSFHRFEVDLIQAILDVARLQGHRGGQ